MSETSYANYYSDQAIMKRIGKFIQHKRLEKNLSQEEVSQQAVMSRSTLSLMERGQNITISNLIKVLRTLDALYVLDTFEIIQNISPMILAEADSKKRKRARKSGEDLIEYSW
ncbi:MAG TPA: helix-turn-helix transcriptional regulator [Chitinophagales bacterium]|nr:helix-turn-helix transcriptional regulator [Chitinophagales bacterium]